MSYIKSLGENAVSENVPPEVNTEKKKSNKLLWALIGIGFVYMFYPGIKKSIKKQRRKRKTIKIYEEIGRKQREKYEKTGSFGPISEW